MSESVEIRPAGVADVRRFYRALLTTFLEDPAHLDTTVSLRERDWHTERSWAAWADGRIVGTLRTMPRRLSVPGFGVPGFGTGPCVDVQADALTGVSVAGTHRRRGLLRQMLSESLRTAHERGDVVSILIAAEWAIYGRFGYWPAATWAEQTLFPQRPGARLAVPVTGAVRQVEAAEARAVAPAIFDRVRADRAGHINRTEPVWDRILVPEFADKGLREAVAVVHEGADGVDGVLTWRPNKDFTFVRGGSIDVGELFATDQAAYTALWGYLLGLDVVEEIRLDSRPVDEPLPYLLADGRSLQTTALTDTMWVRMLDVPAALSSRGYSVSGKLCLDVVDDDIGGFATGRYLLEGGPDGSECRPAPELTPQLRLSQRALAAVYLGAPSLRAQHSAGLVDELEPGALARADAMFATALQPWAGTRF